VRAPLLPAYERILWKGYASWADHALLFLFMALALIRAAFALQSGDWETALLYAMALSLFFGIAAAFHYAVFYQISAQRIRITTGFWNAQTREVPLGRVRSVGIRRELLNRWFNLGSLEITTDEQFPLIIKGVPDPEWLKRELDRLRASSV
jgi:uncharacterized membrane protein YdbT with pleckstrin-like domain